MTNQLLPEAALGESVATDGRDNEAYSRLATASQSKLIGMRFRKHRPAMVGLVILAAMYFVAVFAGFFAPFNTTSYSGEHSFHPPQLPRVSVEHGLYVPKTTSTMDIETMKRTFEEVEGEVVHLGLFVKGDPYQLLGFIDLDRHLIGPQDPAERWYLLGGDRSGGDLFSKILYGAQVSLSIGLIGVFLSLLLGLILGGLSGYFGGWVDTVIQRVIEFFMSIPTLPLWLGLAAAVPPQWGPVPTYLMITLILSLIGWTGLARVIRGQLLQIRTEDFVLAARLDGASTGRLIGVHMVPQFLSYIIANVSLAIPAMILSETALSFLGLGMRPPAVSWGVLLQDAQNVTAVASAPWLLLPGLAVVLAVVAFNFVGDGLRDSADPYGKR